MKIVWFLLAGVVLIRIPTAYPVVPNGVMFIGHGQALIAYDINEKNN
jgi:hypothetical protein